MKTNRFTQLLAEGKSPVGHMLFEFNTRGMAQILDYAGLDFVVIDMEHSAFTLDQTADMVAWLNSTPVAPFVRIPQVHYHLIARVLDAGALGVMAPNVQSGAEARHLVDAAKYLPTGRRGLHFGGVTSDFRPVEATPYMKEANANITVICMIESPEGLANLDAIGATEGVDALWVGHWDLTQYMGIPGQFQHPRFRDAAKKVIDVAHQCGLPAIIQPGSMAQMEEFLDLGFNVISYGADFPLYREALARAVADVRQIVGERQAEDLREG